MDQNQQTEGIFFPPVKKNASYYRKEARSRLSGKWKTGFLVAFLATILGAAGNSVTLSPNINEEDLEQLAEFDFSALLPFLPLFIFIAVFSVLSAIAFDLFVSGPAELGFHRFHLEVIDGNDSAISASTLFRFFGPHYLKAVALRAIRTLITFLTGAPVLVATILGGLHFFKAMLTNPDLGELLMELLFFVATLSAGALITAVIAFPISYMYTFAPMILAEYPAAGAIEAMRNSRHLMRGHKWKLFCLDLSFIGWIMLGALTFGIGIIFVLPYIHTARALYYHDISGRETAKETEFPSLDPNDYTPKEESTTT